MTNIKKIYEFADKFEKAAAKKETKKLDPKAHDRNRGDVVFPAESKSVSDRKDHFEINDIGQARNAIARSHQYTSVPPWYRGSLKSLQDAVKKKVHSKYPSIEIAEKKKKACSDAYERMIAKYSQSVDAGTPAGAPKQYNIPDGSAFNVSKKPTVEAPKAAPTQEPEKFGPPQLIGPPKPPASQTAPKQKFQRINPVFQTMLGVNPDGQLGPTTQGSLNTYKKSKGNPTMSNELAFRYLETEPEYRTKKMMNYNENSGVYDFAKQTPYNSQSK